MSLGVFHKFHALLNSYLDKLPSRQFIEPAFEISSCKDTYFRVNGKVFFTNLCENTGYYI